MAVGSATAAAEATSVARLGRCERRRRQWQNARTRNAFMSFAAALHRRPNTSALAICIHFSPVRQSAAPQPNQITLHVSCCCVVAKFSTICALAGQTTKFKCKLDLRRDQRSASRKISVKTVRVQGAIFGTSLMYKATECVRDCAGGEGEIGEERPWGGSVRCLMHASEFKSRVACVQNQ